MTPWLVPPAPRAGSGDRVAIIAPSSPFDVDAFHRGVARLRAEGLSCAFDDAIFSREGYLAGDDARRTAELRRALHDPSVRAIVAARGGYGATRILDAFDPTEIREHATWLVGFSDATALHALWRGWRRSTARWSRPSETRRSRPRCARPG